MPCGSKLTVKQLQVLVKQKQPNVAVSKLNKTQLLDFYEGRKKAAPKIPKMTKAVKTKTESFKKSKVKTAPPIPPPLKKKTAPPLPPLSASMKRSDAAKAPKQTQLPAHLMMNIRKMATESSENEKITGFRDELIKNFNEMAAEIEKDRKQWSKTYEEYGYTAFENYNELNQDGARAFHEMGNDINKLTTMTNKAGEEWKAKIYNKSYETRDAFLNPIRKATKRLVEAIKSIESGISKSDFYAFHEQNEYDLPYKYRFPGLETRTQNWRPPKKRATKKKR